VKDYDIALAIVSLNPTAHTITDSAVAMQRDLERIIKAVDPTAMPRTALALSEALGAVVCANLLLHHAASKISLAASPAVQEN
jgi:hypothetical protein